MLKEKYQVETLNERKQRITKEASIDLKINPAMLVDENINSISHFQKYWRYLDDAKQDLIDAEFSFNKISLQRSDYYLGKADPSIYKAEPFPYKILKSDVARYLAGDERVRQAAKNLQDAKSLVDYLEALIKNYINNRGYAIRDIIEWKKFTNGQC